MESIHKADEATIRNIFIQSKKAWNTADIDLFTALYTQDVDYITFMGEHISGLESNVSVHSGLWNTYFMRDSILEGEIISIKFTDENTAVMIAKGGVKLRFQKKVPKTRLCINTTVLARENGEWKISSFQNTRIKSYSLSERFMMWIDKQIISKK